MKLINIVKFLILLNLNYIFLKKRKITLVFLLLIFLTLSNIFVSNKISAFENKIIKNSNQFFISSGVVPHHLIAKEIIEDFFKYLSSKEKPEVIIILSPDHFKAENIVGSSFITLPLKTRKFYGLDVDSSLVREISLEENIIFNQPNITFEHGIVNLIPFIKKYLPESKIIPFIIPSGISLEKIDHFIYRLNSLASSRTIIIASVDFSHYLPKRVAEFHDLKSIRTLINFEKEDFEKLEVDCWQCLYGARLFAKLRKRELPKIIAYKNSVDFFKSLDQKETTSYFSVIFIKKWPKKNDEKNNEFNKKTILFVGDIMLDRGVESLMKKNSFLYPFQKINQFLKGVDIVFGNLEGPIVKKPKNFPPASLKFAFSPEVVSGLLFGNFNLLSLANNHTLDMGRAGLEETREILKENKINFVGDPLECSQDYSFEKENITFLAFNKTFPFSCKDEEIIKTIKSKKFSKPKNFLIVSMHWGEEYQFKNSFSQQKLAHKIIDAGADLIIGHHPHLVQNIEIYKGKLIFYSLGNFIFDQYFSKETQEGLAVGLEIWPKKLVFRLFPIQSKLSQPFLMGEKETKKFLKKLTQRSFPQLSEKIKSGIIEIER